VAVKLATWNINGIRARLDVVVAWIERNQPDVLCLQETKVVDELFPLDAIQATGYAVAFAGQKSYNGVALVSKEPLTEVRTEFPVATNEDRRLISGLYRGIRVYSAYFPNGRSPHSEHYQLKLQWIENLGQMILGDLCPDPPPRPEVALLGDFNVAPEERDVYSVSVMEGQIHFTLPERAALEQLQALGFVDAFRAVRPEPGIYSWWDYRVNAFKRDLGLRIDHVYTSAGLAARASDAYVDKEERAREKASDHAPVVVEFADR
jgi:exodeoxyribonuclease III